MAKPKLRFPEFIDEWEEKAISEIATIIDGDRGKHYPKDSEFRKTGYCLFLNAKNVTSDGLKFDEKMFISQEKDLLLRKGKLQREDIIITSRGTVGNIGFYSNDVKHEHLRINSGMLIIRSRKIYPKYLYVQMQSAGFGKQLKIITSGNAQPQLTVSNFNQLKVSYSSKTEQEKIADFLSSIDDIIQVQEKGISALEEQKKGIMQKLFSREVRFKADDGSEYPEWKKKKIGSACVVNPKTEALEDEFYYIDLGSVNKGSLVLNSTILRDDAPSRAQRVLDFDDVVFQSVRPYNMGHYHYTRSMDKQVVASTGFIQLRLKNGLNAFLYQLLYTSHFNNEVDIRCTGSNYPAINSDSLAEIKIDIPCIEEQKKIADCLSAYDEAIQIKKHKLEVWKEIKKGLLQQMFV